MKARERAVSTGDHVLLLYESEAELVSEVGDYLSEGLAAGEVAVVVATEAHRQAYLDAVAGAGVDPAEARGQGRLVAIDATTTLAALMTESGIDASAFRKLVGGTMRKAAGTGRPVRAYGEMVALLWEAGNVQSVIELETLWCELQAALPFSLLCAYPSSAADASGRATAFDVVCELHSATAVGETRPPAQNPLRVEFAPDLDAPRTARRLVVAALRARGHAEELVGDAAIVLTELTTNAVLHAASPFAVTVREDGPSLRISVSDRARRPPEPRAQRNDASSGRGLALVAALTSCWGFETTPDGKVVWAELAVPA